MPWGKLLTAISGACLLATPAIAQSYPDRAYPDRAITLVVPSSAGGGADTVARILANALPPFLGQSVVVENRPGASQMIGADMVAKSAPDGYTWALIGTVHAANVSLRSDSPYDLLADFAPVTQVNASPHILVVNPSVPFETVEEIVSFAKENPDGLNYASTGVGSVTFLATEIFKDQAGVSITEIPYTGGGDSLRGVVSGETEIYFSPLLSAIPFIEDGRLRAIAVTAGERVESLPDVPTVAESGYPDYAFNLWNGLVVPAGTPEDVIRTIRDAVIAAANTAEVSEKLAAAGSTIVGSESDAFGAFIRSEAESLAELVAKLNLKPE